MRAFDLYQRRCYQCGKRFEGAKEWAYKEERQKRKGRYFYFCSWRCLREFDKGRKKAG